MMKRIEVFSWQCSVFRPGRRNGLEREFRGLNRFFSITNPKSPISNGSEATGAVIGQ